MWWRKNIGTGGFMNRFALILIALLFIAPPIKAEERQVYGFQEIPFGTLFEDVKASLQKKYEYGFPTVQVLDNFIKLNDFKLGNRNFDVFLHFDPDKKFSTFSFRGKKKPANYLESEVYGDLNYLTEVFKNKYGNPTSSEAPNIIKIGTRGQVICTWDHNVLFIVTGINVYEFEYYANGMIGYRPLEEKKMSRDKEEKKKGAVEGSKAF